MTGQYFDLLARGFITKEDDMEPPIEGFQFYIDAFHEISTSRPVGMDIQPIPFTAIVDYSRIYEIDDVEEFAYLMRRLDRAFINLNKKIVEAEGNKNAKSATNTADKNRG